MPIDGSELFSKFSRKHSKTGLEFNQIGSVFVFFLGTLFTTFCVIICIILSFSSSEPVPLNLHFKSSPAMLDVIERADALYDSYEINALSDYLLVHKGRSIKMSTFVYLYNQGINCLRGKVLCGGLRGSIFYLTTY